MNLRFKKEDTYSLRGLCMLMIILSHTASSVEPTAFGLLPQALAVRFGYLGTSVFFFISGYGLLYSLVKSEGEKSAWLIKHIRKLLLPFVFTTVVYAIMSAIGLIDIECNLLRNMLTLSLPTADLWFYKVILSIYLLSFVIFSLKTNIDAKVWMTAFSIVAYYIFARCSGWDGWWWNSVLSFPLGMFIAFYTKKNGVIHLSLQIFALTETLLIAICLFFMNKEATITAIAFSLFSVLAMHLVPLQNPVLHFIGSGSIFFYLLEIPAMDICPTLMPTDNYITYSLLILLIVTLLTMVYKVMERSADSIKFRG